MIRAQEGGRPENLTGYGEKLGIGKAGLWGKPGETCNEGDENGGGKDGGERSHHGGQGVQKNFSKRIEPTGKNS